MRVDVNGQPKRKESDFPKQNQMIITPGGFNPQRYYSKSEIDALLQAKLSILNEQYGEFTLDSTATSNTGRTYNNLTQLIAFINFMGNPRCRITLKQSISTTIPNNSNLDNINFTGNGTSVLLGGLTLTITSGSISSWENGSLDSLAIIWASSSTMYSLSSNEVYTFICNNGSGFLRVGSGYVFDASASGAFLITAALDGSVIIGSAFGGSPLVNLGSVGQWVIAMKGSGTNTDNNIVVGSSNAILQYVFSDSSPELDCYTTTQSGYTGRTQFVVYPKRSSMVSPVTIHTASTLSISFHYKILFDASSNAITATLPDVASYKEREYVLHGYDATNTITINTTSSQQIRGVKGDTATSITLAAGDIVKLVAVDGGSGNRFWQKTS